MFSKFLPSRFEKKDSKQNSSEMTAQAYPVIDMDECIGCGICVAACKRGVLQVVNQKAAIVNEENCVGCGKCKKECTMGAIIEIGYE